MTLALVVLLSHWCSSRVEPAALRVRRVRLNHNEIVRTEGVHFAQSRISDRSVVFRERERLFEIILGWPVGDRTCWVSIGEKSRLNLKHLGNIAGLYDVTGQSGYQRNVVDLDQIMDATRGGGIWTLVESARDETLNEHRRWNPVVNC